MVTFYYWKISFTWIYNFWHFSNSGCVKSHTSGSSFSRKQIHTIHFNWPICISANLNKLIAWPCQTLLYISLWYRQRFWWYFCFSSNWKEKGLTDQSCPRLLQQSQSWLELQAVPLYFTLLYFKFLLHMNKIWRHLLQWTATKLPSRNSAWKQK